jgi:hypothetical protein
MRKGREGDFTARSANEIPGAHHDPKILLGAARPEK